MRKLLNEKWEIELGVEDKTDEKIFYFRRIFKGRVIESYRPASNDEALVWFTAILCGFQPPRFLDHLDKPIDRTLNECNHPCPLIEKIQDLQSKLHPPCDDLKGQ